MPTNHSFNNIYLYYLHIFIYSSHRPVVQEPAMHVDLKSILVRPVNFESELQQMSIFTQKILSLIFKVFFSFLCFKGKVPQIAILLVEVMEKVELLCSNL